MLNKWMKKTVSVSKKNNENSATFNSCIEKTKQKLQDNFGDTSDLFIEEIQIGKQNGLLCCLTSMTDRQKINGAILTPLTDANLHNEQILDESTWEEYCKEFFSAAKHELIQYEHEVIDDILNGNALIFVDKLAKVLSIEVQKIEKRAIEEPSTQTIVRGPKEGFVEDVETNVSLIRKKIKNRHLRFESHTIGSETATKVYLAYVDGVTNQEILTEIRHRLDKLDIHALFDSGNLEELLEDKTFTPFPMLYNTERPDIIAAHLLAGKFALFIDGTPFVLSAPTTFSDFVSMSEDYYLPFLMGSFIRLIRYFAFLIALLLPSLYVAVITYHHEMIPTPLLISIISQREGIPFPAVIEALIMEITFEILREAGIRMPRAVGGTISIVGGLVIGQAAVEAGIVSNIMVIVVALTAISSFVAPIYTFAIATRLLRFAFVISAAIFGLYGVFLGMIFLVAHLASLRSFSVPYLAPIAPFSLQDHGDIFIRLPSWAMKKRPSFLRTENPNKQPNSKSPSPPKKEEGGTDS
ncbi:spore germination protein [Anaerobacillus arseniciselenatis]|uniref:Spore germination protein n=1 Tax=Anaerobacillus arseniciselenatis TaxID=85682 RepID=A0A1S2LAB0_9BACI|nr:spore germination protein [Anaerobacillus arseniciselenatis]OIJ08697.1 spore germination protein [Anaerobacillus arseniciselenatis]